MKRKYKLYILSILVLFSILVTSIPTNIASAEGNVNLKVDSVSCKAGDLINIAISISENSMTSAATFELSFDKNLFECVAAQNGEALSNGMLDINKDNQNGKVTFSYINMESLNKGGRIFDIQFKINDGALPQKSNLNLNVLEMTDKNYINIPYTIGQQGEITIVGPDPTPTTTPSPPPIIDTTPPIISISNYIKDLTNKDITVTATTSEGELNCYKKIFTKNGTFKFIATDSAGNATYEVVKITNIDKTKPKIVVKDSSGKTIIKNSTVKKSATITVSDENLSTKTIMKNINFIKWPQKSKVSTTGSYTVVATDKAGNVSTFSFKLK